MTELEPLTPREALDLYLSDRRADVTGSTLRSHRYRLEPFVQWCHENDVDDLNEVTGRDLHRFKTWRQNEAGLNAVTLRTQLSTLRVFLQFCRSIDVTLTADQRQLYADADEDPDAFYVFFNLVTYNPLEDSPSEWAEMPPHVGDWHDRFHTNPLNIILAGRKHTKSTWVLYYLLLACQYNDGYQDHYRADTRKQVSARVEELEELIEANPWLDNLHEDGEAPAGTEQKTFPNGSRLHITSVTGRWVDPTSIYRSATAR